jgi:formate dehydrogenase major subunit
MGVQPGRERAPPWPRKRRGNPSPTLSHPAMAVNLDACIQCNRCVRACREEQVNGVIGYGPGRAQRIVFDLGDPMGTSSCVACGECVQACPTGALSAKTQIGPQAWTARWTRCARFAAWAASSPTTSRTATHRQRGRPRRPGQPGRLCVKGRFGFDYAHHPQRLTVPLIRRRCAQGPGAHLVTAMRDWQSECSARPPGTKRWTWRRAS